MLCPGSGAAAPAPGYIAEEAWWDSPADSEDAGKPPRTQVMATGEMRSTHGQSFLTLLHLYIKKVMLGPIARNHKYAGNQKPSPEKE